MTAELIETELKAAEKAAILKHAEFVILEQSTVVELKKKRNKWVHFCESDLEQIIGELIHHCRSVQSEVTLMFFDELVTHLESSLNSNDGKNMSGYVFF